MKRSPSPRDFGNFTPTNDALWAQRQERLGRRTPAATPADIKRGAVIPMDGGRWAKVMQDPYTTARKRGSVQILEDGASYARDYSVSSASESVRRDAAERAWREAGGTREAFNRERDSAVVTPTPTPETAPSTPTPAPAAPKVDRTAPARAAAKARRAEDLKRSTDPKDNAAKVRAMVENEGGYADLYRRAEAGPSGQKRNLRVGRAEYVDRDRGEYRITDGDGGDTAGWATREYHNGELMYVLHSEDYEGGLHLVGWADTLSLGTDVLINGIHAATGRHDSRRTSGGKFEAYKPKPLRDEV